jgi:hypothetical protein
MINNEYQNKLVRIMDLAGWAGSNIPLTEDAKKEMETLFKELKNRLA